MAREETVEFKGVHAKRETDRALLCVIDGEEHWIPKSQIHDDSEVYDDSDNADGTLVLTEWICKEKGLV